MTPLAKPEPAQIEAADPHPQPILLLRHAPGLILLAIAFADLWRLADPDIWGHVRFGQDAIRAGHILWHDRYSYTAAGHIWLNHEWLTEVIMGALYDWMGVFGIDLLKLLCSALIVIFLAMAGAETDAPPILRVAALLSAVSTINFQVQYRPQIFTFALLCALLYLLARDCRLYARGPDGWRLGRLWLVVPMLALWVNLHGGFIMGVASIWIYAVVAGGQALLAGRGPKRLDSLCIVAALASLATLATPYGYGTWEAVIRALRDPYTSKIIMDWDPMLRSFFKLRDNYATLEGNLYYGSVFLFMLLLAGSFALAPALDDLPLVAIAVVMSIAAFVAMRNMPIAVLSIAVPLPVHLSLALDRRLPRIGKWLKSPVAQLRELTTPVANISLAAMALAISWHYGLFSGPIPADTPYPVEACIFMRKHHLKGNILTVFSWGEYVIWHLPNSKVFIDGRYDTVYPMSVIFDFLRFNYGGPGADAALKHYPTQYVLMDSGARSIMAQWPDWKLIYTDPETVLYARAGSPATKIPGVPVKGTAYVGEFE